MWECICSRRRKDGCSEILLPSVPEDIGTPSNQGRSADSEIVVITEHSKPTHIELKLRAEKQKANDPVTSSEEFLPTHYTILRTTDSHEILPPGTIANNIDPIAPFTSPKGLGPKDLVHIGPEVWGGVEGNWGPGHRVPKVLGAVDGLQGMKANKSLYDLSHIHGESTRLKAKSFLKGRSRRNKALTNKPSVDRKPNGECIIKSTKMSPKKVHKQGPRGVSVSCEIEDIETDEYPVRLPPPPP